jgi:hypothetical protein
MCISRFTQISVTRESIGRSFLVHLIAHDHFSHPRLMAECLLLRAGIPDQRAAHIDARDLRMGIRVAMTRSIKKLLKRPFSKYRNCHHSKCRESRKGWGGV